MDQNDSHSTSEHGYSASFDDQYDVGDYDIAMTHDRNAELQKRDLVKRFFKDLRTLTSLADQKTLSWLADLPFHMREDAIPLFENDAEEYQLHPCYTSLQLGGTARQPHDDCFGLSINGTMMEIPNLVIGIGLLFVNVDNGNGERTSKWTGYEVFVDKRLALWMVFDRRSRNLQAADWYPSPSKLSPEHSFDIACFLPSIRDLEGTKFSTASKKVQENTQSGEVSVALVEQTDVQKRLETDSSSKAHTSTPMITSRKPPLSALRTGDSTNLDTSSDRLRTLMWDAVLDPSENAQKMTALLTTHGQNLRSMNMLITERLVEDAASNEACGGRVMSILIDRFSREVRKSISSMVVKRAASNHHFGRLLMEDLLGLDKKAVCSSLSISTIRCAAENEGCGAPVLELLFRADERLVTNLIAGVIAMVKTNEWSAAVYQSLDEKLEQIGRPTLPPLVRAGPPKQNPSVEEGRHGVNPPRHL